MKTFHRLCVTDPEAYERIGPMLEDFACNGTPVRKLSEKYNLGVFIVERAVKEYLGDPKNPFYVSLIADQVIPFQMIPGRIIYSGFDFNGSALKI